MGQFHSLFSKKHIMEKKSIVAFLSWFEMIEDSPDEVKVEIMNAFCALAHEEDYTFTNREASMAWKFISDDISRNEQKYNEISKKRRAARLSYKQQQTATNSNKQQQTTTNDNKQQQTPHNDNENENENENENGNGNDNDFLFNEKNNIIVATAVAVPSQAKPSQKKKKDNIGVPGTLSQQKESCAKEKDAPASLPVVPVTYQGKTATETASERLRYNIEADGLQSQALQQRHKLTIPQLLTYEETFRIEILSQGETDKGVADYAQHFARWLPYQLAREIQTAHTASDKTRGASAASHEEWDRFFDENPDLDKVKF